VLDEPRLGRYLDACRLHGKPMARAQALRALADQALLSEMIDEAFLAGATLLRRADAAGYTLLCQPCTPIPHDAAGLQELSNRLAAADRGPWQIWTGRRWLPLPPATTA
jgi:hypothetical protein